MQTDFRSPVYVRKRSSASHVKLWNIWYLSSGSWRIQVHCIHRWIRRSPLLRWSACRQGKGSSTAAASCYIHQWSPPHPGPGDSIHESCIKEYRLGHTKRNIDQDQEEQIVLCINAVAMLLIGISVQWTGTITPIMKNTYTHFRNL